MRALKERVAQVVDGHLEPIRERFEGVLGGEGKVLEEAARVGAEKARRSAEATMKLVREAVGF